MIYATVLRHYYRQSERRTDVGGTDSSRVKNAPVMLTLIKCFHNARHTMQARADGVLRRHTTFTELTRGLFIAIYSAGAL